VSKVTQTRLPKSSDRIVIIGRTGSGKTVAALWHLSKQAIDRMPWIVVDYKNDENINSIEKAQSLTYDDKIPSKPGVYILHCLPGDEEAISQWFSRVWEHEGVGIYVDEGYMVGGNDKNFNACLTQGRSKKIPMIVLSQRPLWLSRFVFSEANFFQVFHLNDKEDRKTVKRYIPAELDKRLPEFHSYYYDVDKDRLDILGPVPMADKILADIDAKLPKVRRTL